MRLYSKKDLRYGILYTALGLLHLWQNRGQLDSLPPADCFILACLSVGVCISFYTAFSRKHGMRAWIEEHDEREKLLQLKIYRTSFWICLICLFLLGGLFRTHAADEATGYVGTGMQLSAFLLLLLRALICGVCGLLQAPEQTESAQ